MDKIKFGTDGWRAIIAKDYTVNNVRRVAEATAQWILNNGGKQAVIGYDCRFGGQLFADTTAGVFASHGITSVISNNFSSTPMVSLATLKTESTLGVVITASHNPPDYNGYKLKSSLGGPMIPAQIAEVEALIPDHPKSAVMPMSEAKEKGLIKVIDLEQMYIDHVEANFDMDLIRNSGIKLAYDAMYGAGQNAVKRLLPDSVFLNCDVNPSFKGQAPEPIHRNLTELSETIKNDDTIHAGLANDGDADRIGMYDEKGNFVDSHRLLLLLLKYMKEYKQENGKVVVTFSVTDKMKKLAEHYGLDFEVTKIGFKYIAEIMTHTDLLVGGEESGGLAVKGHIPERDGVWMGLLILEFMAKTGKSLTALLDEVYEIVGRFEYDRDDLHLTENKKQEIISKCKAGAFDSIGSYSIVDTHDVDGYRFILEEGKWVMIRPSGTEPVLRVYAQGSSHDEVRNILDATHESLLN